MKTKGVIIALLFLLPQIIYSQRTLTNEQWLEDLEFMINRIDSIHPGLYKDNVREDIYNKSVDLKGNIPVLSDHEILVELLRIVSTLHDGHTRLHGKNLTKTWFPLRMEQFSDGYYITATSESLSNYIGARVLAVNNQAIDSVFEKLREIIPGDNIYGQEYFAPMFFTMSSILSGLHIIDSSDDHVRISLKSKNNKETMLSVFPEEFETGEDLGWFWKDYAVPADRYQNIMQADSLLPYYLQNYNSPYWFKNIGNNTFYFAFNACENEENEHFNEFNSRLWKTIDSVNTEYLIIDLRNNFGGTNSILEPLIREIIKHERINREAHLFIITSKKTFSAAVDCAAWIEYHCHPVFAGEPAGAGPNHYADADFSILPNSRILLMVSKYYWQDSWPWDDRKYIDPGIKVSMSSDDYFNFRDPVMDEISEYIRENR